MPLNLSGRPRNSKKEAEALRQIILPPEKNMPALQNQHQPFTPNEYERLREVLLQHDRGNLNQFDPNNPPKVSYAHQEFPKMVYDHEASEPAKDVEKKTRDGVEIVHVPAKYAHRIVHNEEELKAAIADGYQEQAPNFNAATEAETEPEPEKKPKKAKVQ